MPKQKQVEVGTPEWWKETENLIHNDPATHAYSPEPLDPRVIKRILCEFYAKTNTEPPVAREKEEDAEYGS